LSDSRRKIFLGPSPFSSRGKLSRFPFILGKSEEIRLLSPCVFVFAGVFFVFFFCSLESSLVSLFRFPRHFLKKSCSFASPHKFLQAFFPRFETFSTLFFFIPLTCPSFPAFFFPPVVSNPQGWTLIFFTLWKLLLPTVYPLLRNPPPLSDWGWNRFPSVSFFLPTR